MASRKVSRISEPDLGVRNIVTNAPTRAPPSTDAIQIPEFFITIKTLLKFHLHKEQSSRQNYYLWCREQRQKHNSFVYRASRIRQSPLRGALRLHPQPLHRGFSHLLVRNGSRIRPCSGGVRSANAKRATRDATSVHHPISWPGAQLLEGRLRALQSPNRAS